MSQVLLSDFLEIRPGVTAVIGGGGKTTLLKTLGQELAQEHTVLLCTTTKIFPFSGVPCACTLEELECLRKEHRLLCCGKRLTDSGKLTMPDIPMAQLAAIVEYVLVEADGSAGRPLKAHAQHEPVIPEEANQTICVVGASGFGKPVAQVAHRPEIYAGLAGIAETADADPVSEAAVLNAEALQDRVYVNQVETKTDAAAAGQLAERLRCPVLAGSLFKGVYEKCW